MESLSPHDGGCVPTSRRKATKPAPAAVTIAFGPTPQVIHDAYERLFEAAHEFGIDYSNQHAYSEEAAEMLPELLEAAIHLAKLIDFKPRLLVAGKAVAV